MFRLGLALLTGGHIQQVVCISLLISFTVLSDFWSIIFISQWWCPGSQVWKIWITALSRWKTSSNNFIVVRIVQFGLVCSLTHWQMVLKRCYYENICALLTAEGSRHHAFRCFGRPCITKAARHSWPFPRNAPLQLLPHQLGRNIFKGRLRRPEYYLFFCWWSYPS